MDKKTNITVDLTNEDVYFIFHLCNQVQMGIIGKESKVLGKDFHEISTLKNKLLKHEN